MSILDGTVANTLRCTVGSRWNGDTVAAVDNIAKGATTGGFTLDAGGTTLRIEAAILSGNVLYAMGVPYSNASGTDITVDVEPNINDIFIQYRHATTGVAQDITAIVDGGDTHLHIMYVTDA